MNVYSNIDTRSMQCIVHARGLRCTAQDFLICFLHDEEDRGHCLLPNIPFQVVKNQHTMGPTTWEISWVFDSKVRLC